ncbi:MAG: hypothetical protein DMF58_16245 [Acidobacteria bacterium]|nr:MAG: hypothetical protein DMF58_16245 [Acidobacteriota bacterium]
MQASQRFSDAINAFQRSIEIQPTSAGYSNLARCEFYLGRYVEAAAAFEKATVLTPNNYVYWANLGDAYRWTPGQQTKAPAAFQRAIRLAREAIAVNPNDAAARSTVATCLAKSGSIAAANSELMLALKADPTSSGVLYQAAVIANIRGDRDSALAWLSRAIASNLRNQPRFRDALNGPPTKQ